MWIGLTGKRGVGKTLAATYLSDHYKFTVAEFSRPIREIVSYMFGLLKEDYEGVKKEQPLMDLTSQASPRDIMIAVGNLGRYFHGPIWIEKVLSSYKKQDNIIIDGVRFKREVDYIKNYGGIIIKLLRYPRLNIYKEELIDQSETELDDYEGDKIIYEAGNTTETVLRNQLDIIMKELNVKPKLS